MTEKRIFVGLSIVALAVIVVNLKGITQQKNPSIQNQLSEIMQAQTRIEQKLAILESKQANAFGGLRAGPAFPPPTAARQPMAEDLNKVHNIPVGNSPVQGNPNAKVTIVEFSDFQCPYSQRFHPIVSEVLKAYPKDVKFVFKNFPLRFHSEARPAAKALLAAKEQGKYWEMMDALFQNGRNLGEEKYKELAGQLGLNVGKFMKDLKERDAHWEKLINEDEAMVNAVNVMGTPTFYINGKKTQARDMASFKAEIDRILNGGK